MQLSKECPEHNPCCLVRLESAGERDAEVSEVRLEALEPLCGVHLGKVLLCLCRESREPADIAASKGLSVVGVD
jgi:hypothetical protein